MKQLEKDIQAGNNSLQAMPYDLLTDKDGLNLREYQRIKKIFEEVGVRFSVGGYNI